MSAFKNVRTRRSCKVEKEEKMLKFVSYQLFFGQFGSAKVLKSMDKTTVNINNIKFSG